MAYYDVTGVLREGDINEANERLRQDWHQRVRQKQSAAKRGKVLKTVAGGAALFGGGLALSSLLTPAATAASLGPQAAGAAYPGAGLFGAPVVAAGTKGGGMTLGSIFGSRGFETGANALTSLFGMRSQNKANRYAADQNARILMDQIRLEQERNARLDAAAEADRLDRLEQWKATEAARRQEFDALQEERAYNRSISDRNLRLDDEREARRAMFRPYSERAMRTLGQLLRIG